VIETSATSDAPSNCTELETQDFVEQTEFAKGQAAVASCREADPSASAESVEVANVEVDGDEATADATFEGSSFNRQTLALALVRDEAGWKLDRIVAFRGFDKDAFLRAFEKTLLAPPDPATGQQAACIIRLLRRSDDEKLQDVLLGGDPKPYETVFGLCA